MIRRFVAMMLSVEWNGTAWVVRAGMSAEEADAFGDALDAMAELRSRGDWRETSRRLSRQADDFHKAAEHAAKLNGPPS